MKKTPNKIFNKFIKYTKKWLKFWGIHKIWFTEFKKGGVVNPENIAEIIADSSNRHLIVAFVRQLDNNWQVYDENLDRYAFHESAHALLAPLADLAKNRTATQQQVIEAEHEIIVILENVVLKKLNY